MEQSLNVAWVLVGGFLVMFMQVGFAMVETGFTRAKNAVNTMAMNFVIYPLGALGFWLCGYGPTVGGHVLGFFGASRFALVSVPHHAPSLAMFLFAAVFMDTAATIPTGTL